MTFDEDGPDLQFYMSRGYAVQATREPGDSIHSPHALKVMVPISSPLEVHIEGEVLQVATGDSLLVNADQSQRSTSGGWRVAVFFDPETTGRGFKLALGERVHQRLGAEVTQRLCAELRALPAGPQDDNGASAVVERIYRCINIDSSVPSLDPRVLRVLAELQRSRRPPSTTHLARVAGLSPSRFAHLFTEEIGIPMGRYSRWARLVRALELVTQGVQVTEAAVQTGFADLAHLSRTSRAMLGQRLSVVAAGEGSVWSSVY